MPARQIDFDYLPRGRILSRVIESGFRGQSGVSMGTCYMARCGARRDSYGYVQITRDNVLTPDRQCPVQNGCYNTRPCPE